jgi:hypothetical protein
MAIERWTNPKSLGTKLDSGTIPNGLEGFWIGPSFKDRFFLSRSENPDLTIRHFFIVAVPHAHHVPARVHARVPAHAAAAHPATKKSRIVRLGFVHLGIENGY